MKASPALPKPAERDGNVGRAPAWMERGFVRAFPDDHVNQRLSTTVITSAGGVMTSWILAAAPALRAGRAERGGTGAAAATTLARSTGADAAGA